jgi:AICAR transformylase/IMP cyclohydrolase PurH
LFLEVIVADSFHTSALKILKKKKLKINWCFKLFTKRNFKIYFFKWKNIGPIRR